MDVTSGLIGSIVFLAVGGMLICYLLGVDHGRGDVDRMRLEVKTLRRKVASYRRVVERLLPDPAARNVAVAEAVRELRAHNERVEVQR